MRPKYYRDMRRAWVGGVLAGIAQQTGIALIWVRLLFVLGLSLGVLPMLLAYGVLCFVMPKRDEQGFQHGAYQDWPRQSRRESPVAAQPTYSQVASLWDANLKRLGRLESYLVSASYDLDVKYKKLEHSELPQ